MLQYISFYRFKEAFFLSLIALGKKYILKATLCERNRKWILPRMLLLWRWKWWFYSVLKMVWSGRLFTIDRTYMNEFFMFFNIIFNGKLLSFIQAQFYAVFVVFLLKFFFHSHHLPRLPLIFSIIITVIVPISTFLQFSSWIHLIKDYCKLLFDDVIFLYFYLIFINICQFFGIVACFDVWIL